MLQRRLFNNLVKCCQATCVNRNHGNGHQNIYYQVCKNHNCVGNQQYYTHLTHRKLVEVSGENTFKLIQGLVTNDVDTLSPSSPLLYAHLLNVKGRVLFDTIIYYRSSESLFVEVESEKVEEFIKMLKLYNLRSNVKIRECEERVYALFGTGVEGSSGGLADPRLLALGYRYIGSPPAGAKEVAIDLYHSHRVALGIGEGGRDISSGSAFPFEHNLDYLNGVSFTKGCYIGQELTARTHHIGETRKRVVPVTLDKEIEFPGSTKLLAGKRSAGKLISVYGTLGLAIVRFPHIGSHLLVEGSGVSVTASRPTWWQQN